MKNVYSVYNAQQSVFNAGQKRIVNNPLCMLTCTMQVLRSIIRRAERKRMNVLMAVARLYSTILEERVSTRKAALLLKAQAAFLGILIFSYSPLLCIACVIWFAKSLIDIKVAYD